MSSPADRKSEDAPTSDGSDRGRNAEHPGQVPPQGWLDILARTKQQLAEDNLTIVAAGVAFYSFVSVGPALAAVIAFYALIANPADINQHIEALARIVPGEVMPLLQDQIKRITSNNQAAGISAIVGVLLAIYSSSNAMKALITGLNIAYDENEKRGFFKLLGVAVALTLLAIAGSLLAIGLMAVLPIVVNSLHLGSSTEILISWIRWPVLVGAFMIGLTVLYRFGPSRDNPQWKWASWGAGAATLLWIAGSAAFSFYVSRFGSYDKTYGTLGAVIVFLFWLFLTAFAVLIGAELNAEMERQTVKDTTRGAPQPLGQRNAKAADTVGPTREQMRSRPSSKPQRLGSGSP